MAVKRVIPTVEDLAQPAESNINCLYDGCGQIFKHRPALNMHLAETHGLKEYGTYGKGSKSEASVVYVCPISECQKSSPCKTFKSMKLLKQHYRNMHAEKNYSCPLCNKKFSYADKLMKHKETCGKTFHCSICDTPYKTLDGLKTHQRNMHNSAFKCAKELMNKINKDKKTETLKNDASLQRVTVVTVNLMTSGDCKTVKELPTIQPKQLQNQNNVSTMTIHSNALSQVPEVAKESCGTQTDVLRKAVHECQLNLCDQSSNTEEVDVGLNPRRSSFKSNPRKHSKRKLKCSSKSKTTLCSYPSYPPTVYQQTGSYLYQYQGHLQGGQYAASNATMNQPSSQKKNQYGVESYSHLAPYMSATNQITDSSIPAQTYNDSAVISGKFTDPATISDFGTQTAWGFDYTTGNLMHAENVPSNTAHNSVSFSTQTAFDYCISDCYSQTDVSSFGTETLIKNGSIPEPNYRGYPSEFQPSSHNLQQSTSDFSMQFPFETSNFGTQTCPSPVGSLMGELYFSDDMLSTVTHSQSATQTDLEALWNSIETQTEFQNPFNI